MLEEQFDDGRREASTEGHVHSNKGCTLTVMMGGPYWPDSSCIPTNEEILAKAEAFLKTHLDETITSDDYISDVKVQRECIPQYTVGYNEKLDKLHTEITRTFHNKLYLSGTSFGSGAGINDCILDSLLIASRFSPQRKALWAPYYLNRFMTLAHPFFYA
jgi:oxygen-dependent protoporphyrinogen oxidase